MAEFTKYLILFSSRDFFTLKMFTYRQKHSECFPLEAFLYVSVQDMFEIFEKHEHPSSYDVT
jgi:hypothetical protein